MLSRGGDVAVAGMVGKFKETNTDILIVSTLVKYIRLVQTLKRQSFGCSLQICFGTGGFIL